MANTYISYELAKKYWNDKGYGPSVIFFKIKMNDKIENEEQVWKWMKRGLTVNDKFKIEIKTSFGGEDKISSNFSDGGEKCTSDWGPKKLSFEEFQT